MFLWDEEAQQIAGAYRMGLGNHIYATHGIDGFYLHELFRFEPELYDMMSKSIEMGRAFIISEYQQKPMPLFLLWKGILHFLLANPKYRYLIGPVSISKDYSEVSKGVIVEFVKRFFYDKKLAQYITPRKPFRPAIKDVDTGLLAENLQGQFTALEALVESMEPAHFTVPVLFRQYLRQNAKFIGFNVDPNFADCLDGLMILDIRDLPEETLELLQQEK